jgi:hypothetical protein
MGSKPIFYVTYKLLVQWAGFDKIDNIHLQMKQGWYGPKPNSLGTFSMNHHAKFNRNSTHSLGNQTQAAGRRDTTSVTGINFLHSRKRVIKPMEQQPFPEDVCYVTDRITIDVVTRQDFPTSGEARKANTGNVTSALAHMCSYLEKYTYYKFISSIQMFYAFPARTTNISTYWERGCHEVFRNRETYAATTCWACS